jgi:hypothetical protein
MDCLADSPSEAKASSTALMSISSKDFPFFANLELLEGVFDSVMSLDNDVIRF